MNQPLTGRDKIDIIERIKHEIKDNQITAQQLFPDNPLIIWTVDDIKQHCITRDITDRECYDILTNAKKELEIIDQNCWDTLQNNIYDYIQDRDGYQDKEPSQ